MPKNIFLLHLNAQITGRKIQYRKVPNEVVKHVKDQDDVWNAIRKLDKNNFISTFSAVTAIDCLKSLRSALEKTDGMLRFQATNPDFKGSKEQSCSDTIHLHGGIEVILRTLFHPSVQGKAAVLTVEAQHKIQHFCIEVLHGMCIIVGKIALTLGKYEHLLKYLFVIMEERKIFLAASSLLEELLAANRKIIDLSKIKNLPNLVSSLREGSFPGFCRIISSNVADIDMSEERTTLVAQDKEEKNRMKEKSLVEQNQGLLLNLPEFMTRMVKLASRPFPGVSLNSRLMGFQNLFLQSSPLDLSDVYQLENDQGNTGSTPSSPSVPESVNNTINNIHFPSSSGGNSNSSVNRPSNGHIANEHGLIAPMQLINEVMHKVEILYVLTLFLCGKYKYEVQSKLGDLKFIPTLSDMFDKLGWNTDNEQFPRHSHHETEDCDCTPESALKIQFLRFVHSFCDHNEKKYLLLSALEIQEVKRLCSKHNIVRPAALEKAKNKYRCHGSKGLIVKIIEVLKKTSANNALRFWLSRAVEGFLRGAVSPPDQHFLMNRGLVMHLVEHITNEETKAKEIIQSSFDLLGELLKFNSTGFQYFNDALENDQQFNKFLSVMTSNVIDSNMFIRSVILSREKFYSDGSYDVTNCKLGSYIRRWEHKIYLMYKLINSIAVESLTQENVSCLNTTLIFFMFAYNHGYLDKYLQAFLSEEEAQKHPGLILSNLHELLLFWRTHYLSRGKDCSQLEQSSSITFDKWQHIVDVMLNDDLTKRTSIMYYLTPVHRNNHRLRTVDYLSREV